MQNPRLASRYAKSLIDLAVERNSLEDTLKDMQLLNSICEQSKDFVIMLRSPVIPGAKKKNVVKLLLEGRNVSQLTQIFVDLLVTKGRESVLPEIVTAFQQQYNALKNIRTVKLTTASAIGNDSMAALKEKIAGFMPANSIELKTAVDPSLIGGFVIEMEDKLYDASIKKSLNDFKSKVIDTTYEAKLVIA
jgi:F-type H+-transporting ATPase subunit delta